NGKPLEEAQELIDQMLVQFPSELKDERPRLLTAKKEVRAQLATRDYDLAKYYDRGEHYGAARYMYAKVMKDYPDTSLAVDSKERVAQLEGKPDEIISSYEWMIRPLESDRQKA